MTCSAQSSCPPTCAGPTISRGPEGRESERPNAEMGRVGIGPAPIG